MLPLWLIIEYIPPCLKIKISQGLRIDFMTKDFRFDQPTLKSLIEEQTRINEQAWKKVTPCLLIY